MGRYVIRRLLQMIPVFIGTTLLIFLMVYALGDPVAALFGDKAPDPATAARIREELHLDEPLWKQYLLYMGSIFQGDFGTAFNGQQVTELMAAAFPVTLRLTVVAILIEIVVGVTLGVVSGLKRGRPLDTGLLVLTLVVISVPTFVSGYLLQYLFGVKWGWINPSVSSEARFDELLLPGVVLALVSLAYVTRLSRTSIAENTRADYVRTAVAKGLPRRRVITRHLLRNSLIPVVTFIGADIGALMGGAIVTERIFNIHGVGYQLYQGILRNNSPTVVGFVTILVIVFLVANLLVDLLYAVLDPRIRYA
ncbi:MULTISPECIES: ABC transporter permease [Streptomyces]|jgi:ABC-type dipeptide/oligopeptide/nickel transport systems, permease components|uniref:Dipeptide transport system permease protein DppB n=2 Tax=Streptomyces TaxID=1883 RepID=A0A1D8G5X9_9ACTN|nr:MULTISPECIES: ABC transporter permease [Streptomyces]AOT60862.1 Dipeptide transport system permease protein DppB [Streptomyces rubrolavendulae]KAF0651502.1 ABC transporter permease [Streptomyces fradiae ATCC 10745 = DSM 40063]OSY53554.1 Dipeptide transport system permease protein DppB [Streptomyces fradiae ATCC 10745 = DSM 40063]QEV13938.1 ABC transporter permease [Streptomyces fradiae ATCC 10745 = DSM 40063]UQS30832.1 ABC transporter permease [Streptomyces fradiae]